MSGALARGQRIFRFGPPDRAERLCRHADEGPRITVIFRRARPAELDDLDILAGQNVGQDGNRVLADGDERDERSAIERFLVRVHQDLHEWLGRSGIADFAENLGRRRLPIKLVLVPDRASTRRLRWDGPPCRSASPSSRALQRHHGGAHFLPARAPSGVPTSIFDERFSERGRALSMPARRDALGRPPDVVFEPRLTRGDDVTAFVHARPARASPASPSTRMSSPRVASSRSAPAYVPARGSTILSSNALTAGSPHLAVGAAFALSKN